METIEQLVEHASYDMFNPRLNFGIAKKYEEMGQTASAVSFYLRTAEYGHDTDPLFVYASLLRMSVCFSDQREREHTVKHCLLQAIQYLPNRPEAYFLLSSFYERLARWQECYTTAELGLINYKRDQKLPIGVDYPGPNVFFFEKAVSGWWLGKEKESLKIFNDLLGQDLPPNYIEAIKYNLKVMGAK